MNRRILPTIALAFATSVVAFAAQAADIKNIVIVHGAFADGSGWRQASDILERRGFNVTVVRMCRPPRPECDLQHSGRPADAWRNHPTAKDL